MASQILLRLLHNQSTLPAKFRFRQFSSTVGTVPITASLFPGDGIGPEISQAVKQIFRTAEVPIEWEEHYVGKEIDPRTQSVLTWESLESVRRNKVGLRGPMATTHNCRGHRALSLTLRKKLIFFANVRLCFSFPGYKTAYDDVNLVIIRENTEGEYSALEHQVVRGVVESLQLITRKVALRVAEYAFHYARAHRREKVTAIHKTDMQITDTLFLKCCREVAEKYRDITYEEVGIDHCCMMLVKNPTVFDVLVMPNLYGNIVSDLCAGLIGGLRLTPSFKIGEGGIVLAEVVHSSASDIAGKNMANPTALVLSGVAMLHHLELHDKADNIQKAVLDTIVEGRYRTGDLGGFASTTDFTNAVCDHL